jgi:hypothetical protein
MTQYIFGLDMSLTSPALAMYNSTTGQLDVVCVAQRKREIGLVKRGDKWSVKVIEGCAKGVIDVVRYKYIVCHFVEHMLVFCNGACEESTVRIEQYAFGANGSHSFKLQELGGCLKMALYEAKFSVEPIAIGSWKKQFTGKGNATKREVYDTVVALGFAVLLLCFGLTFSKNGDPPSPINDICDAIGILGILQKPNGAQQEKTKIGADPKRAPPLPRSKGRC